MTDCLWYSHHVKSKKPQLIWRIHILFQQCLGRVSAVYFQALMMQKFRYKYYHKWITTRDNGNVHFHDQDQNKLSSRINSNSGAYIYIWQVHSKRTRKMINLSTIAVIHYFFLMGIFLKHLWLIPDISKWQNCKIFTNVAPSQDPSRRGHRKYSVNKDMLNNLQNLSGKHLYWSMFCQIKFFPSLVRKHTSICLFCVSSWK